MNECTLIGINDNINNTFDYVCNSSGDIFKADITKHAKMQFWTPMFGSVAILAPY